MAHPDDEKQTLQYIDLFSGCGGLALGLCRAGWSAQFAVEKDPMAFKTLDHNLGVREQHYKWPDWLPKCNHDINVVLETYAEKLTALHGKIDLIAGGPPCQGFSMDGRRRKSDKRNSLIRSYIKFVEILKPKVLFFENVKGFTIGFKSGNHKDKPYSDKVLSQLRCLGYKDVQGRILDFSEFGIPQRRKRFIIVGTLNGKSGQFFDALEKQKDAFLLSKQLTHNASVRDAISDLEQAHGLFECPDSKRFQSGLYGQSTSNYQKLLKGNPAELNPDSHRFAKHTKATLRVFRKLLKGARRNRKINGAKRKQFGLKKRSVTVLDGNTICPTLTSIPDDYIHYAEPRILSVRECARIQSFPDNFHFKGKYTTGGHLRMKQVPRYTQIGNAIPPLFAEQAGLALAQLLP